MFLIRSEPPARGGLGLCSAMVSRVSGWRERAAPAIRQQVVVIPQAQWHMTVWSVPAEDVDENARGARGGTGGVTPMRAERGGHEGHVITNLSRQGRGSPALLTVCFPILRIRRSSVP